MKQFAEFLPIAIFAGVYFWSRDIFLSTGILMIAMLFQVAFEYFKTKYVSRQTQFILWSVLVLGGMTLIFRNEIFIQWKPTIVNWAFCVALLASQLIMKDNLLKKMLGQKMQLPQRIWRNLALGWSGGFFIAGLLNLVVAYSFSMDFWVSYKLVGGFALTLCYVAITVVYLVKGKYLTEVHSQSNPANIEP